MTTLAPIKPGEATSKEVAAVQTTPGGPYNARDHEKQQHDASFTVDDGEGIKGGAMNIDMSAVSEAPDNLGSKIDPVAARRLRWKIDRHLYPILFVIYCLAFLDRINISNARIQGLTEELQLYGNRFNIALFVSHIQLSDLDVHRIPDLRYHAHRSTMKMGRRCVFFILHLLSICLNYFW